VASSLAVLDADTSVAPELTELEELLGCHDEGVSCLRRPDESFPSLVVIVFYQCLVLPRAYSLKVHPLLQGSRQHLPLVT
jgi:hypothetical protein